MTSYAQPRFRMTIWPGTRLPTADLGTWVYELAEDRKLLGWALLTRNERLGTAERRADEQVAALGEIYLELAVVDLDNEEAILDFANRFGILGIAYHQFELIAGFPGFSRRRGRITRARRQTKLVRSTRGMPISETVEEFRYGAQCIRDL